MIKPEVIKGLYTKYPEPVKDKNNLNLELFKNDLLKHHAISITDNSLIINTVDDDSPFKEIPLRNITGIEEFDKHVAIILRNSILFLNKENNDIHVHINFKKPSILDRLRFMFSKNK